MYKLQDIIEKKTNPNIFLSKLALILILWIIVCICSITSLAAISVPTVNDSVTERHNIGVISDKEYNTWQNIVTPAINVMFLTMRLIIILLIILSFVVIIYPFYELKKKVTDITSSIVP